MVKRYSILALVCMALILGLSVPAWAQEQEAWSMGGGYWTLPNVDDQDGAISTSGMYACAIMHSTEYQVEFDYAFGDTKFYALAADYLYPLTEGADYFGGSAFLGAGYTYFSADDLDNQSGFNVLLGAAVGDKLSGTLRYDFLGSDQELFALGVSYSF